MLVEVTLKFLTEFYAPEIREDGDPPSHYQRLEVFDLCLQSIFGVPN